MKKITVKASKTYDIHIGVDILDTAGEEIRQVVGGNVAAIITDDIVSTLYEKQVTDSLIKNGYRVVSYTIPNGESSKNPHMFTAILNFLAEEKLSRTDLVVALGGGVVGDLAGFAAASYMRGIPFVQIPTTLLAAIDSSVGGKTAINLLAGKNLAGAFYQPDVVICDISTLSTLSDEVFADGCAEVIKYGVIADKELFELIKKPIKDNLIEVIAACVEIKRDIVIEDERENGIRKLLNFGHTIGHGIEALSGYSISHGHAVAAGMAIEAKAAAKMNLCDNQCVDEIVKMLRLYNLPESTDYSLEELADACLSDKKRDGDSITMIFPIEIGKCILKEIPVSKLQSVLELEA